MTKCQRKIILNPDGKDMTDINEKKIKTKLLAALHKRDEI